MEYPMFLLVLLCTVLMFASCRCRIDPEHEKAELLRTDRDCAALSAEKGFPEAYRRYLAPDAVVMPPGEEPLFGREEIDLTFRRQAGEDSLQWEPEDGDVSGSGDLGWTRGTWIFTTRDENGEPKTTNGKYVFIWKKLGGDWKIAANIWNDSPPPT